tara:strand:- start:4646 stop:6550 length:1905 start_codon:yes stop_codon:yes gene_type:complete
MSLVVTSNIGTEDDPAFSNVFKPFSYQNRLLNTMRIPPMSEIALQSAKINKNGLFILDRTNSGFCHYFGTPIEDLHNDSIENSTTQPFRAVIGAGEAFRAGDKKNEVNIDDMANEIKNGLDEAAFHPSLITGEDTTSVAVDPLYDATTASFKGFKFVTTQQVAKTTRNAADIEFTDISKNESYNFTQAAGKVTSSDVRGFYVQNREYPISQNAGTCTFNFSNAQTGVNPNWMVGLSRISRERAAGDAGDFDYLPNYFDDTPTSALLKNPIHPRGQYVYADICVMRFGNELRVYQSGARTAAGIGDGIYMNEVTYYGAHNANFNAVYDIDTNADDYKKVKFTLTNEEIKIELIAGDGGTVLLCDYTTLRAAGAVKNQCLNPVNAAKWAMYPVCSAARRGANPHVAQEIELESIDHYTNYPEFDFTKYHNYDWWGWSQEYNETIFCKKLEMRDWNNFSRTTTNHGVAANGLLAPKRVNASGGMDGYKSLIITAKSAAYGTSTNECNTQFTLGFVGDPVSRPTVTNIASTNESSTVPQLVSNISLFIRLNNFTQNSVNARQGTNSKIIAHLPRFDNSGNETGGLYFEPHEKTYLALNNTDELLINSFDVDIVYDNETLCTALSGKTIVCFHIRPQKK